MISKAITAMITVIVGIGAAVLLYWLLNKFAELLPGRWEDRVKPYFFILPAYAAISMYLLYPTVLTVINSFKDRFSHHWVGAANYRQLLGSAQFRQTLFNTLLWIVIVPATSVVLGLGIATLADRLRPRQEKLTKTIIFLPMAISLIGASTIWRFVYYSAPKGVAQIGLQNGVITALGADPVPWLQKSTFHVNSMLLMVILLWAQVGFSMVLLSSAVKGVPAETLEAARIDGATERQVFLKVTLPSIKGTIITVFVTVTIGVMKIFDIVYVTTNGNFNTNVIGNEFYNQLTTFNNNGTASSIVVMLMVAVIPVMVYQVRHFRAQEREA